MGFEQITFENHNGKTITFGDGYGFYVNENELRDYEWEYTTANNRIKSITRGVVEKKVPIVITGTDVGATNELKNMLANYADEDVYANEKGRFWIGDYYLSCFIVSSKKSKYSSTDKFVKIDLGIVTDQPYWTKEDTTLFRVTSSEAQGGIEEPYDYEYDYGSFTSETIVNNNYSESNVKLVVYGACDEIDVYIGDNRYHIEESLEATEYAVIDTREKKAYKMALDGTKESIFGKRDRDWDLFAKVAVGTNVVQRDGYIDITLYDERSEPLWI